MRLNRVKEGIHWGRNTSIPELQGWKSVHLIHKLEQREYYGSVISGSGWTREIPRMMGTEV